MLQLLQHLGDGRTFLTEAPAPSPRGGALLIQTSRSLVSAGTERMLVNFGKAGWLGKMRQQPEKVRAVIHKVRAEGLISTWAAVRSKLNQPIPLGYCQVGRVVDAGSADWIKLGQRAVSNGAHAEVVSVAHGLCAEIPDGVDDEAAAFTPLGSIALQGINLLALQPGDRVVVMGLGLIGQLAVRILVGLGCEVLGFDPSSERRRLSELSGARTEPPGADVVASVLSWTSGRGAKGVLITASSSSNVIVSQAARSCAHRGKVVLVGVVGLLLNRADFYSREVMFQVSCSYGARDPRSPHSAQGNFRQILAWMAEGRLPVADLVTHRGAFADAAATYAALDDPQALGILLEYGDKRSDQAVLARTIELPTLARSAPAVPVAMIGTGNFATRTLLPALTRQPVPVELSVVVSARGLSAMQAASAFAAARATTEEGTVFSDSRMAAVFITTRHDVHASQALAALTAGKHVWVEKPLALTVADVEAVTAAARTAGKVLLVGFNRRFSPLATRVRRVMASRPGPFRIEAVVNAGRIDADHWTLDPRVGGGRIVGEGCHFIDLLRYLSGAPLISAHCIRRDTDGQDGGGFELAFADGSAGLIDYRTDLSPHIPKERITVSGPGFTLCIHNWTKLTSTGLRGLRQGWMSAPRKGHPEAVRAFLECVRLGSGAPIPLDEIREVSRWAIRLQGMVDGERATVE